MDYNIDEEVGEWDGIIQEIVKFSEKPDDNMVRNWFSFLFKGGRFKWGFLA